VHDAIAGAERARDERRQHPALLVRAGVERAQVLAAGRALEDPSLAAGYPVGRVVGSLAHDDRTRAYAAAPASTRTSAGRAAQRHP
jgi:hypothetical protein